MRLTRRDWLKALLAAPIAATLDVEQLLWVPKPIITVPTLPTMLEIDAIVRAQFLPDVIDNYFQESPMLKYYFGTQQTMKLYGPALQANLRYSA